MTDTEADAAYLKVLTRAIQIYARRPTIDGWRYHPPMPLAWDDPCVASHVRHECLVQAAKELEAELTSSDASPLFEEPR